MRVAAMRQYGQEPVVIEWAEPSASAGEAVVAVALGGLNPFDLRVASGTFYVRPPLPYVPGSEGVGVVRESARWPAGTRVRFQAGTPGALAEVVVAADEALVEVPDAVDDAVAAALGVAGLAAWCGLQAGRLAAGERVLVLGATGAVGRLAVQVARLLGAGRVVAAGRDAAALDELTGLGADATVQLTDRPAAELAESFTDAAGGPLDVVLDPLWGAPALAAVLAAGPGGRLVNIGDSAGDSVALPSAVLRSRQLRLLGYTNLALPPAVLREAMTALFQHAAAGRLRLEHRTVPLDRVGEAWREQAGSPHRKLLVQLS